MLFAIGFVNRHVRDLGEVCVCVCVCVCVRVCVRLTWFAFMPVLQKDARSDFKLWWVTGDYRRASFMDDNCVTAQIDRKYERRDSASSEYGPFFWVLLYVLITQGSHLKKWMCPGAVACVCVCAMVCVDCVCFISHFGPTNVDSNFGFVMSARVNFYLYLYMVA
jgi:hypothetical protein